MLSDTQSSSYVSTNRKEALAPTFQNFLNNDIATKTLTRETGIAPNNVHSRRMVLQLPKQILANVYQEQRNAESEIPANNELTPRNPFMDE